jgi:hypothetical protein
LAATSPPREAASRFTGAIVRISSNLGHYGLTSWCRLPGAKRVVTAVALEG